MPLTLGIPSSSLKSSVELIPAVSRPVQPSAKRKMQCLLRLSCTTPCPTLFKNPDQLAIVYKILLVVTRLNLEDEKPISADACLLQKGSNEH